MAASGGSWTKGGFKSAKSTQTLDQSSAQRSAVTRQLPRLSQPGAIPMKGLDTVVRRTVPGRMPGTSTLENVHLTETQAIRLIRSANVNPATVKRLSIIPRTSVPNHAYKNHSPNGNVSGAIKIEWITKGRKPSYDIFSEQDVWNVTGRTRTRRS